MAPGTRSAAVPVSSPVDESAAALEHTRVGKWLDAQPDDLKSGLDELAALDLAGEDDGPGEG
jgi:hypothetical protein